MASNTPLPVTLVLLLDIVALGYRIQLGAIHLPLQDKKSPRVPVTSDGVVENDIHLDKRLISVIRSLQAGNNKRGAIFGDNFRWPASMDNGKKVVKIPYVLEMPDVKSELNRAIDAYNDKTCVRFVPRKGEEDYLRLYAGPNCMTSIGRQKGSQKVSLRSNCNHMGTIIHELMHALGFLHEQSRTNRDSYVKVNFENMIKGLSVEYKTYDQDNQGIHFDFRPIMLYQTKAGSSNGKPTMVKNGDPTGSVELGNKDYFSAKDLLRVNRLYGCSEQFIDYQDYIVTVRTGSELGAGTNDYVYINLVGTNGQESGFSSVGTGEGFNDFERGMEQTFNVVFKYVGPISHVRVHLFGGTWFPVWNLAKMTVKDPKTKIIYTFNYNNWIKDGETKTIQQS